MDPQESIKITIRTQRRRDGGLRAWSADVPGLVLSHADPEKVMADIIPAVETIMTDILGYPVQASELVAAPSRVGFAGRRPRFSRLYAIMHGISSARIDVREYVAAPAPCLA